MKKIDVIMSILLFFTFELQSVPLEFSPDNIVFLKKGQEETKKKKILIPFIFKK